MQGAVLQLHSAPQYFANEVLSLHIEVNLLHDDRLQLHNVMIRLQYDVIWNRLTKKSAWPLLYNRKAMKVKIIASAVLGLIVVALLYLFITRNSRPVLFHYGSPTAPEGSAFLVQNPFRERGPEDEAVKILQDLKNGNCEQVLKLPTLDAGRTKDSCEKEAAYPIQNWSIVDRQDFGKQSILVYSVERADRSDPANSSKTITGLAWIDVEKTGEESWRVLSYQTYY
jgi:hypothetical protein